MGTVRMGSIRLKDCETRIRRGLLAAALAPSLAGCADAPRPSSDAQAAYAEIVAEEDARGAIGLERVRAHLAGNDPGVRAMAVRALGRLEDGGWVTELGEKLDDPDPRVRMAAATALAQSVYGADPGPVLPLLAGRIEDETDAEVVGGLATNLGRLAFQSAEQRAAGGAALATAAQRVEGLAAGSRAVAMLGLARGIEALARSGGLEHALPEELVEIAKSLTNGDGAAGLDPTPVRTRRLAAAALTHTGQLGPEDMRRLLADEDWGVRRQVLIAATRHGAIAAGIVSTGLRDPDPRVRVEALRAHGAWEREAQGCGALLAALDEPDPDVAATALDLLASPCPEGDAQRRALASRVTLDGGDWRGPVRALFALSGLAPVEAMDEIRRHAEHRNPFVRAWAARSLARAGQVELAWMVRLLAIEALGSMSGDENPNVREAALQGLATLSGGDARDHYLAALESDDPQLVMTAARMLAGHNPDETSAPALLAPLARFTAARRETERDARVALLEAIGTVGGFSSGDLTPYLADFDPVVADMAAALLTESTGSVHQAAPKRLPRTPPPDAARLAELAGAQVVLHMADLGPIVIALRPDLGAANADRFARLAEEGYFDGLTFHRVVPNFVIQGGSPHANEYMGDGPYSRDEISDHPHWRGTVGLSTRGRDTGDAQIFINLVDNVRLDFNYTIYGEVVEGMEIADAVQEGAVIERAEVVAR